MGKGKGKSKKRGVKATIATVIDLLNRPLPLGEFTGALTQEVENNPLLRPINHDVKAGANVAKQQCARMKLIHIVKINGDRFVVLNPDFWAVKEQCEQSTIAEHARFLAEYA